LVVQLMVGPAKTLFMDEISTGLDSSTTYLIVRCIRNYVHLLDVSVTLSCGHNYVHAAVGTNLCTQHCGGVCARFDLLHKLSVRLPDTCI
jgi:ABC-type phosphonate transport system ATPase subunit